MKSPKIVVTRAIFPEVLEHLEAHLEVTSNQRDATWAPAELIDRLQGCEGALTSGVEPISKELLEQCPKLRICANLTVGYNNFNLIDMTSAGVLGTNSPDVLTETTADFGFALLLATARRITEAEHFLRRGDWKRWSLDMLLGCEVHGSTLGIIGMGRIGQSIARRAALGFGMRVLYHNRTRLNPAVESTLKAEYVSKEHLLRSADHVLLVLPYSTESHHTIAEPELSMMKPSATLVNIARGGIVDEVALATALRDGKIAGAGLDVFEGEPKVHADLLALRNVVLTPHIASATRGTRRSMAMLAADNLIDYLVHGTMRTPLNPEVARAFRRP